MRAAPDAVPDTPTSDEEVEITEPAHKKARRGRRGPTPEPADLPPSYPGVSSALAVGGGTDWLSGMSLAGNGGADRPKPATFPARLMAYEVGLDKDNAPKPGVALQDTSSVWQFACWDPTVMKLLMSAAKRGFTDQESVPHRWLVLANFTPHTVNPAKGCIPFVYGVVRSNYLTLDGANLLHTIAEYCTTWSDPTIRPEKPVTTVSLKASLWAAPSVECRMLLWNLLNPSGRDKLSSEFRMTVIQAGDATHSLEGAVATLSAQSMTERVKLAYKTKGKFGKNQMNTNVAVVDYVMDGQPHRMTLVFEAQAKVSDTSTVVPEGAVHNVYVVRNKGPVQRLTPDGDNVRVSPAQL